MSRAVVVYDQVGCGKSEKAPSEPWRLSLFMAELAALRAELGLEQAHVLGTSWGGMLALEHALAAGETVRSLVLSSTLASAAEWAREARRLRDELPPRVLEVLDRHERARTYDDPEYERALEAFDAAYVHRRAAAAPELARMRRERGRDAYAAMWGPNEWTIIGELRGWDVRDRLHTVEQPCLVIRGRYDLCTATVAATLLRGLPSARMLVFDESSHMPVLEETERYLAEVASFLEEVERAA